MKAQRFDAVELQGEMKRTSEGFLQGKAIITRTGIFQYADFKGDVVNELRHPDDVFKAASLASLHMRPMTLYHPDELVVTADNAKRLSVGHMGQDVQVDGRYVYNSILITDKGAIEVVEKGVRELSLGYFVDLIPEAGKYDGVDYQFRQTNIDYNHLAIVERARAGPKAALNIVDGADRKVAFLVDFNPLKEIKTNQYEGKKMEKNLVQIILDSGLSYDAAPEIKVALEALKKGKAELQARFDTLAEIVVDGKTVGKAEAGVKAAFEAQAGRLDGMKAELEKAKADFSETKFAERVQARARLESMASAVLDGETVKRLDIMKDADIMKALVLARADEAKRADLKATLESCSAEYLKARFDIAAEGIVPVRPIDHQRAAVADAQGQAQDGVKDPDRAREAYLKRIQERNKTAAGKK